MQKDRGIAITIARVKREEPKVYVIRQPGSIPARPKYMQGEPGYVESVARTCPNCRSVDVWRGPWCTVPEMYLELKAREAPVKHSGRKRHAACLSCGEFRTDIQAIPYEIEDWADDV